jgi:hypothetical protein
MQWRRTVAPRRAGVGGRVKASLIPGKTLGPTTVTMTDPGPTHQGERRPSAMKPKLLLLIVGAPSS